MSFTSRAGAQGILGSQVAQFRQQRMRGKEEATDAVIRRDETECLRVILNLQAKDKGIS